ncbi:hypothetical protein ACSXAY_19110 (plasmid) [Clostridium perfringens]
MTSHIKRFGEYVIDLNKVPGDIPEIDIEKIIKPVTLCKIYPSSYLFLHVSRLPP